MHNHITLTLPSPNRLCIRRNGQVIGWVDPIPDCAHEVCLAHVRDGRFIHATCRKPGLMLTPNHFQTVYEAVEAVVEAVEASEARRLAAFMDS